MSINISYKGAVLPVFTVQGHYLAFTRIFEVCNNSLRSIEFRFTHSTIVARVILQDVFFKKWLRRDHLTKIDSFRGFLFVIILKYIYKASKLLAKNNELALITHGTQLPADNDSAILVREEEYNSLLQKAVNRLPKHQTRLYHFINERGFKSEKAAGLLHLSPEAVILFITGHENIRTGCRYVAGKCITNAF